FPGVMASRSSKSSRRKPAPSGVGRSRAPVDKKEHRLKTKMNLGPVTALEPALARVDGPLEGSALRKRPAYRLKRGGLKALREEPRLGPRSCPAVPAELGVKGRTRGGCPQNGTPGGRMPPPRKGSRVIRKAPGFSHGVAYLILTPLILGGLVQAHGRRIDRLTRRDRDGGTVHLIGQSQRFEDALETFPQG